LPFGFVLGDLAFARLVLISLAHRPPPGLFVSSA
jgi:hypothetical protein